ncbi:MAG: cytochrome c biogenesis protein CcsA [Chloroflexi bacterium]|nr:cytochrome c biogenesis protein CcsA [Chloroflexota bacterium]
MESTIFAPRTSDDAERSAQTTRAVGAAALALLIVALLMVFVVAPKAQDASGGQAQRIFYFHVSAAWIAFSAWLVSAYGGVRYLRSRDMKWDRLAVASAEIGVMFIVMVLLTGMLWGRPTWNAWWTWDFKLTLSLLQFLMYLAYLVLRSGVENPEQRARFSAVYGIIGSLTIPLNFLVSRVLQSIHPAVFGDSVNARQQGGFGLAGEMVPVLLFSLLTFTVFYVYFLRARIALQEGADQISLRRAELAAE